MSYDAFLQTKRRVYLGDGLGLSDSYEAYYQAIRRCWRFGQTHPVDAFVIVSEAERTIVQNVRQKEAQAGALADELLKHMRVFERREVSA